ncbi:hypothetical protein B0H17DRAFT_1210011 [Mycena rosella]|uniref:Uncharacterized protein n=1 Tax=Mycena rosella TaxID=1033263 RepID=A0AAD7G9A9_MYCRO|nr:hypothetical protein B0H17DRAFT_1210011 [Mycena rosella]
MSTPSSTPSTSTSTAPSAPSTPVPNVAAHTMTILTTAVPRDPFVSDEPGAGFRRRVVLPTLARFGVGTIQTTVVPDDPFISDIPEAKAKALPSYFRRRVVPVNKSFCGHRVGCSIILTKSVPDDPFFTEIPEAQARGAYFRRRVVLPEAASEQSPSTRMPLRRRRSARASVLSGLLSVYNWRSAPAAAV